MELEIKSKFFNQKDKIVVEDSKLSEVTVEALKGQDINVNGITSKGIANTGGLVNIGDVAVNGDITATKSIKGPEILEVMEGYTARIPETLGYTITNVYVGASKTGNKLTLVFSADIVKDSTATDAYPTLCVFDIPHEIYEKLVQSDIGGYNFLDNKVISAFSSATISINSYSYISKVTNFDSLRVVGRTNSFVLDTKYHYRYEATFLLGKNLVTQE